MSEPVIRGWCPGAHRPMMSGDGLVVRVRPWLSRVTAKQARGLSALAVQFGTGFLEMTSRANLQIRGVTEEGFPELLTGLETLGLLDNDVATESNRNIVTTPFRGSDHDTMAQALTTALAAQDMPKLPGKFGFVIDAEGRRDLAQISGDIRIEQGKSGWLVRANGNETGRSVEGPEAAVEMALEIARWFVASGGIGADGRGRMARHLAKGHMLPDALMGNALPFPASDDPDPGFQHGGMAVSASFGLLPAAALAALADLTDDILVTPFRMLFLPEISKLPEIEGLITRADDPMRRVVACSGAPYCPQAEVDTRSLAARLASQVGQGRLLHVTGCAKGCAHPMASDLVLIGAGGKYNLVTDGCPWDQPIQFGLDADDLSLLESRT